MRDKEIHGPKRGGQQYIAVIISAESNLLRKTNTILRPNKYILIIQYYTSKEVVGVIKRSQSAALIGCCARH